MLYSVHNPVAGGFDYYQAPDQVPLNDDLPTPQYGASITTAIGVPATEAARPLPQGSVKIGSGQFPKGSMSSGHPGVWFGNKKIDLPSGMGDVSTEPSKLAMGAVFILAIGVTFYFLSRQ